MLVHYLGLELPIYHEATAVAWTKPDMRVTAQSGVGAFIRKAVLEYNGPGNLQEALDIADDALQAAADVTDTQLVNYEWGLYYGTPPEGISDT